MKKVIVFAMIIAALLAFTACGDKEDTASNATDPVTDPVLEFVEVGYCEGLPYWLSSGTIVYHKETLVMYVANDVYLGTVLTPLYDAEGKPLLWEEGGNNATY